jgi:hypothetical protein
MKKILPLILIASFSLKCFAQTAPPSSKQQFHLGLKAAPSLAWLTSNTKDLNSDGLKFGFSYGLITEFNFADHYAFATGLDITYRGGKFKQDRDTSVVSNTLNLEYVEIPLTLKFKTNEIGYFTYFLQFGVAPGFNIRARGDSTISFKNSAYSGTSASGSDIKDSINLFNLSMIISGGLEYSLSGSTVLLAAITFNNGFVDVLAGDKKANSDYLALTIGVLF